jgi:hypothetical protein
MSSDQPRHHRSTFSRAVCKGCNGPNDREYDGNRGGLYCQACIRARRADTARFARDRRIEKFAKAGIKVCTVCYRKEAGEKSRCDRCLDREIRRANHQAVVVKKEPGCTRCYLRGAHECTRLESRRSSFENMRSAG